MRISKQHIDLFHSLFRGREDVYARRWENEDREGYIPAYLERSRSGNGGHVWIFFQQLCPAWKSRKMAFHLLRKAGILSEFEKDASFDRLFPNQDYHSGKGLDNLIALPLNKKWMAEGNTCFIDPETGQDSHVIIPRGFLPDLIAHCKEEKVSYHIEDRRQKKSPVAYQSSIELYPHQSKALEPTTKKDFGVIVAPPGSGKTIMGLELIARKQQPALIIVHRKQLFDQWIERIKSFLGIPEKDIGKYSGSHKKKGKPIR